MLIDNENYEPCAACRGVPASVRFPTEYDGIHTTESVSLCAACFKEAAPHIFEARARALLVFIENKKGIAA